MAVGLTKFTKDVNNIQKLSDTPTKTDGLTPDGLKQQFDKAGSDIKAYINETMLPEIEQVLNQLYPIGRGFIDFTDTDYSNYLGFVWERELVGMTPVGLDKSDTDFDEIGKTGGSKKMQKHRHTMTSYYDDANYNHGTIPTDYGRYSLPYDSGGIIRHQYTDYEGEGDSGNLQPYKVVAFWKRVA